MNISLALPSKVDLTEKESIVKTCFENNVGVFLSDLPPNHDLFQLIIYFLNKYSDIHIGTAIISPLSYNVNFLVKQIQTLFEIHPKNIELGFGVGDRKFITESISKPFLEFKKRIHSILLGIQIDKSDNLISIAGSGEKMLNLAYDQNLPIIFNGIPDNQIINNSSSNNVLPKVSIFVMAELSNFEDLSNQFIEIVYRILTSLSKKEQNRLEITSHSINLLKTISISKEIENFQEWLDPILIKKVAFFGSNENLKDFLQKMKAIGVRRTILSFSNKTGRENFFSFLKSNDFND